MGSGHLQFDPQLKHVLHVLTFDIITVQKQQKSYLSPLQTLDALPNSCGEPLPCRSARPTTPVEDDSGFQ